MRRAARLLALLAALAVAPAAPAAERTVDLTRFLDAPGDLPTVSVEVDDPVYETTKRYEGFALDEVLRRAFPGLDEARAAGTELVLRAADGYAPSMGLDRALEGGGVIAFRDLDVEAQPGWRAFQQGKATLTPAPYYLVWPGVEPDDARYKWPYQLVEVALVPFAEKYGAAVPEGADDDARHGFVLFKENCMSCHSVNLVGGDLAPELNVPRNIAEYWAREHLVGLIRDASAYRARSKMPAFPDLSDADIDAILAYLDAMATRKVCGDDRPCE